MTSILDKRHDKQLEAIYTGMKWGIAIVLVFSLTFNGLLINELSRKSDLVTTVKYNAMKVKYDEAMVSLEQEVKLNNELMKGK